MGLKTSDIIKQAAAARLNKLKLQVCFDPFHPDSRPTVKQDEFFKDAGKVKFRYLIGGNGCLAKGTLVATPEGPVAIEDLKVGDTVYSEHGTPIKILKTFVNGRKEVVEITNRGMVWAEATDVHVWQVYNKSGKLVEKQVQEFSRDDTIVRKELFIPLGKETCPYAYALGALLGDGCSTSGSTNRIIISSSDKDVVDKVALQVGTDYKKCKGNYNWAITTPNKPQLYKDWCEGRKAHEKIVDLDVIKSWDRESLLQFVAGLIDTDGSVYLRRGNTIGISLGMQAKSVIEAFQYSLLALWQTPSSLLVSDREKYVNGPLYEIKLSSNAFTKRILKELSPYLKCERKQWKPEYETFKAERSTSDRVGQKLLQRRIIETYDIHVDSDTNLYCLANGLVTHNSGKSATGGREITWIVTDTHPYWKKPKEWGSKPLQCLVIGASKDIVENELWANKVRPFLDEAMWRVVRKGNSLAYVEHKETKDKIIFLTHADGSQKAIDNLMAYDADAVWVDEMPRKYKVLEETQRRSRRPNTLWFATFTPKSVNLKIRKMVDSVDGVIAKKYGMSRLDVPGVEKDMEIAGLHGLSESEKRTILYGDWAIGEDNVYNFDADTMLVDLPLDYSAASWRHVECVDPGSNRGGITIWAEHPTTHTWYCVLAQYIDGLRDPVAFYDKCQELTRPFNIVRRICDPAATPHLGHAAARKCSPAYIVPYAKNQGRKAELIKNVQKELNAGRIKLVEGKCGELADELGNAQWNESGSRIINAHAYHLTDAVQYFVDLIPKPTKTHIGKTRDQLILEQDDQRRAHEAKIAERQAKKQQIQQGYKLARALKRGRRWML